MMFPGYDERPALKREKEHKTWLRERNALITWYIQKQQSLKSAPKAGFTFLETKYGNEDFSTHSSYIALRTVRILVIVYFFTPVAILPLLKGAGKIIFEKHNIYLDL